MYKVYAGNKEYIVFEEEECVDEEKAAECPNEGIWDSDEKWFEETVKLARPTYVVFEELINKGYSLYCKLL